MFQIKKKFNRQNKWKANKCTATQTWFGAWRMRRQNDGISDGNE